MYATNFQIFSDPVKVKAEPRIDAFNPNYVRLGGDIKVLKIKLLKGKFSKFQHLILFEINCKTIFEDF